MNESVPIGEISSLIGVTSRTIRFWESEGLFECKRHPYSGHRCIESADLKKVKLCSDLRDLGISIKDIKRIFESPSVRSAQKVIAENLAALTADSKKTERCKSVLKILLGALAQKEKDFSDSSMDFHSYLGNLLGDKSLMKTQEKNMKNDGLHEEFEIVELPKMRAVYNIAISKSPEDEAMKPVLDWLKKNNLLGVSRLFGGNVKPFPTDADSEYGYGMCATISSDLDVPDHLKEMTIPGGLYALCPSDDDIAGSWKKFMKDLKKNNFQSDRSRLCFEEHIYYGKPGDSGYSFHINLLEPLIEGHFPA